MTSSITVVNLAEHRRTKADQLAAAHAYIDNYYYLFVDAGRQLAEEADGLTARLRGADPELARCIVRFLLRRAIREMRKAYRRSPNGREHGAKMATWAAIVLHDAYVQRLIELNTPSRSTGGAA